MCVMTNKHECQLGMSSKLRGSDAETTRGKGCVDFVLWSVACWLMVKMLDSRSIGCIYAYQSLAGTEIS